VEQNNGGQLERSQACVQSGAILLAGVCHASRSIALWAIHKRQVKLAVRHPLWHASHRGLIVIPIQSYIGVFFEALLLYIEPFRVMLKPDNILHPCLDEGIGRITWTKLHDTVYRAPKGYKVVVVSLG
jgi:hypothetical protein